MKVSGKAAQFTESVIREMTRIANLHGGISEGRIVAWHVGLELASGQPRKALLVDPIVEVLPLVDDADREDVR